MATITVWKKALKRVGPDWSWKFVIVELTCEEETLLMFDVYGNNKCRVPEATVVAIHESTRFCKPDNTDWMAEYGHKTQQEEWESSDCWSRDWYVRTTHVKVGEVVSWYDHKTKWVVGETTKPHEFDPKSAGQCAAGIHVFKTRKEAEDYFL